VLPKVDLYMNMYEDNFFDELGKLDKSKKYLIYCWHANRTGFLLNYMRNTGFEYVKDLAG
jgi:rhodanese-related sulfurtransferase